jgi:uncharacterized protein
MVLKHPEISLQIRPTVDELAARKIEETATFLESLGVQRIHFRPMSSIEGTKLAMTSDGYAAMAEGFDALALRMLKQAHDGREIMGCINILKFLFILFFRLRRQFYCGAGSTVISVDPRGNITPCPRFTGMDSFQIGNIGCGGISLEKKKDFQTFSSKTRPNCQDCWARNACAGGCLYMHEFDNSTGIKDFSVWCDLTRSNITSAIKSFAALQKLSPHLLPALIRKYPPLLSNLEEVLSRYETSLGAERR